MKYKHWNWIVVASIELEGMAKLIDKINKLGSKGEIREVLANVLLL